MPPNKLQVGSLSPEERAAIARWNFAGNPRTRVSDFVERATSGLPRPILLAAQFSFLNSPSLDKALPNALFYSLRFPQYPLAMQPPAPLADNNLFVIDKDGKLQHLTSAPALETFFRKTLPAVKTDEMVRQAVTSWMLLSAELTNDGMYQFSPPDISVIPDTASGITGIGRMNVVPKGGDSGYIESTLVFSADGQMKTVSAETSLSAGIRPVCQSTKLLDKDPTVRKMAEQHILVMGRRCKFYLDDQSRHATPELKRAIDRLWQRIVREHR